MEISGTSPKMTLKDKPENDGGAGFAKKANNAYICYAKLKPEQCKTERADGETGGMPTVSADWTLCM